MFFFVGEFCEVVFGDEGFFCCGVGGKKCCEFVVDGCEWLVFCDCGCD